MISSTADSDLEDMREFIGIFFMLLLFVCILAVFAIIGIALLENRIANLLEGRLQVRRLEIEFSNADVEKRGSGSN